MKALGERKSGGSVMGRSSGSKALAKGEEDLGDSSGSRCGEAEYEDRDSFPLRWWKQPCQGLGVQRSGEC